MSRVSLMQTPYKSSYFHDEVIESIGNVIRNNNWYEMFISALIESQTSAHIWKTKKCQHLYPVLQITI